MVANVCRILTKSLNIGKRALKVYPHFVFSDKGAETLVKGFDRGLKKGSTSIGGTFYNGLKTGGKDLEQMIARESAAGNGLWTQMAKSFKTLPKSVTTGAKAGARLAKIQGKNAFIGGAKGVLKGIGKHMPLIGNALLVATALPTIFDAFKDDGFFAGVTEIAKEGTKLAGFAIGSVIGSAFGPVGTIVGGLVGSWVSSLFTGKSHDEKVAEQEEAQQLYSELLQQQYQTTGNVTNPYYYDSYGNDPLYQNLGFNFNKVT